MQGHVIGEAFFCKKEGKKRIDCKFPQLHPERIKRQKLEGAGRYDLEEAGRQELERIDRWTWKEAKGRKELVEASKRPMISYLLIRTLNPIWQSVR